MMGGSRAGGAGRRSGRDERDGMADETRTKTLVELDELSDHDLLVRIAGQCERLPCENHEVRIRAVEIEVAKLRTWGIVIAALVTGASTVISVVLGG